ncbi:MAG TPA: hypothetical protein VEL11_01960 [Candidatus Bathyarchaeia archaeon]|nr:hypothetical protein [Candidatus Bathyarchaeia archaeon]
MAHWKKILKNYTLSNRVGILADNDTIRSIAKTLPHHCCLVIGKVVSDLPIVLEIVALVETEKF